MLAFVFALLKKTELKYVSKKMLRVKTRQLIVVVLRYNQKAIHNTFASILKNIHLFLSKD